MPLQQTGAISFADISDEVGFAANSTIALGYANVRHLIGANQGDPVSLLSFYGKARTLYLDIEIIGGGGGGGYGLEDGAGTGRGGSGGQSIIDYTHSSGQLRQQTASGALGGRNGFVGHNVDRAGVAERGGDASFYGDGGKGFGNGGGENTNAGLADAPATSYGAGGGGAGGDQGDGYDSDGNAGEGGQAAERQFIQTHTQNGSLLDVVIGAKGAGAVGGNYNGGDGAAGYCKCTIRGGADGGQSGTLATYTFTATGTATINV